MSTTTITPAIPGIENDWYREIVETAPDATVMIDSDGRIVLINLQKEIVSIENQVADRREFYNSAVTNWNTSIEVIPANIVAGTMGAQRKDTFTVEAPEVRKAVKVEF